MEINIFLKDFEQLFEDIESGTLTEDSNFRNLDEWSSLIALMLIAMAEENYHIRITGEDIRTSVTVRDLFDKLAAKVSE
jgi:acyl carrier protein